MARPKSGKCRTISEIKEEIENTVEQQEEKKIDIYYKCQCGHEDYLATEEKMCAACMKELPELKDIECVQCQTKLKITENVKICPFCNDDLETLEERMENAGVIPTDDPVKAQKISDKKKEELQSQLALKTVELYKAQIITEGFMENSFDTLLKELKDKQDTATLKKDSKEKNRFNSISSKVIDVYNLVEKYRKDIPELEIEIKDIQERINNIQPTLF